MAHFISQKNLDSQIWTELPVIIHAMLNISCKMSLRICN